MDKKERNELIKDAHDSINNISDSLKDKVDKLNDNDLHFLVKEIKSFISLLKNPVFKWSVRIIIACLIINTFFQLGYFVGQMLGSFK